MAGRWQRQEVKPGVWRFYELGEPRFDVVAIHKNVLPIDLLKEVQRLESSLHKIDDIDRIMAGQ